MTQEYTPVAWQDETTSQQGTLINAERLNQMQTAHHYADGFEEVDAVPTADPSVAYHKVVYCTADSTFYRWDGTAWTADIDDETKRLLEQEIARATEAEGELAQDLADETTARETADTAMQADITAMQSGKLDKKTTSPNQTQAYAVRGSVQRMITVGYGPESIPLYGMEETLLAKMPTLYDPTADTVVNYGWATAQIGAEATARAEADTLLGDRITAETAAREGADTALGNRITAEETRATQAEQANAQAIANTYTKSETDTLLASKADQATTLAGYGITDAYTKTETDTLLAGYVTLNTAQTIPGAKTFSGQVITKGLFRPFIVYGEYTHDANTVYPQRVRPITIFPSQNSTANPIGRIEATEDANRIGLELSSTNYDTGDSSWMTIWTDKTNGAKYTTLPNLPSTTSADMVPNLNYISQTGDSAPNNLLHKSGDETKTGKLVKSGLYIEEGYFAFKNETGDANAYHAIMEAEGLGAEFHVAFTMFIRGETSVANVVLDITGLGTANPSLTLTGNNPQNYHFGVFYKDNKYYVAINNSINNSVSGRIMGAYAHAGFPWQPHAFLYDKHIMDSTYTQVVTS